MKVIANLKTDIDVLKSTLAEKNIEYQENKAENLAIKDIADHRALDISKLKNELSGSIDQNNRLKEDKRALESNVNNLALGLTISFNPFVRSPMSEKTREDFFPSSMPREPILKSLTTAPRNWKRS